MSKAQNLLNSLNESSLNEDWNVHKKELKKAGYDLHPDHKANIILNRNNFPQLHDHHKGTMSNGETMYIGSMTPESRSELYASVKNSSGKFVKHYRVMPIGTQTKVSAPKSTAAATPENILAEVRSAMKMAPEGRQAQFRPNEKNGDTLQFDVRYWGNWEVPDGEEDDGDYDWEVLTEKSSKVMKNIIQSVKSKYPNAKINWSVGEKNYIEVYVVDK